MPFFLWQKDQWFANGSLGLQASEFETRRSISYPSLNPDIASVDTDAISENDAFSYTANLTGGYSWFLWDAVTLEPSAGVNYQQLNIDTYRERDINNDGFDFVVNEQDIPSLETFVGLKLQYLINTRFGVYMPFVSGQFYAQHESDPRFIEASYASVTEPLDANANFVLPTNGTDKDYKIYAAGIAAVIRGSRQRTLGQAASGGVQVFVQYRQYADIGGYEQKIISGGIRYEF